VQVCTAAMLYGFRIIEDMVDGLSDWMDDKGYRTLGDFTGLAVGRVKDWNQLNINFDTKAQINPNLCIDCGRCHIACEDTSHQAIRISGSPNKRLFTVVDEECVGCNLCAIVCPVPDCITMQPVANGKPFLTWPDDPRNPMAAK